MLFRTFFNLLHLLFSVVCSLEVKYHSNAELEQYLKNFTKTTIGGISSRLYSIGKSVKGNELWVLELTAVKEKKIGVPNVKLIGTIHGNEPVGREILLYFMEYLHANYQNENSTARWLLENTKIHFLPNFNPDGFAIAKNNCEGDIGRYNMRKVDLNRNFPDYFHKNRIPEQAETAAVKKWLTDVPFILSGALHGGALVANYPFDSVKEKSSRPKEPPSLTPDNDVFKHLANVYARNHLTMHKGVACEEDSVIFPDGITNGAEWYALSGGMQDYNYVSHGCMELTLEISCCKYPPAKTLPQLWEENKEALLMYCMEAHRGVTGQILDLHTLKPIVGAILQISGRNMTFKSKQNGEFWRLLLPGDYKLEIFAEGYYDEIIDFKVKNYSNTLPQLTSLNVFLVNCSLSTTTEESTQETTNSVVVSSTTDVVTLKYQEVTYKYMSARQIREKQDIKSVASKNVINILFYLLLLCLQIRDLIPSNC